jgi:3'-5' exoribonuclease 1
VQEQVNAAPSFPEVLESLQKFLVKHGLIDEVTGERLVRFCWCSDGPFDVRDFVVKQCFISRVSLFPPWLFVQPLIFFAPLCLSFEQIQMPGWIQGDIIDVRTSVMDWLYAQEPVHYANAIRVCLCVCARTTKLTVTWQTWTGPRRRTLNIPAQLKVLGLSGFEGREHSGIDVS